MDDSYQQDKALDDDDDSYQQDKALDDDDDSWAVPRCRTYISDTLAMHCILG